MCMRIWTVCLLTFNPNLFYTAMTSTFKCGLGRAWPAHSDTCMRLNSLQPTYFRPPVYIYSRSQSFQIFIVNRNRLLSSECGQVERSQEVDVRVFLHTRQFNISHKYILNTLCLQGLCSFPAASLTVSAERKWCKWVAINHKIDYKGYCKYSLLYDLVMGRTQDLNEVTWGV